MNYQTPGTSDLIQTNFASQDSRQAMNELVAQQNGNGFFSTSALGLTQIDGHFKRKVRSNNNTVGKASKQHGLNNSIDLGKGGMPNSMSNFINVVNQKNDTEAILNTNGHKISQLQ